MEHLVTLLQALGQAALRTTRSKHKIFTILRGCRDVCNITLAAGRQLSDTDEGEVNRETILEAMYQCYKLVDCLERYVELDNSAPLCRAAGLDRRLSVSCWRSQQFCPWR